jgi:hypothetical protein
MDAAIMPKAKGSRTVTAPEPDAASQPRRPAAPRPSAVVMASARNQPNRMVARGIERVASQPARPSRRSRARDQPAMAPPITEAAPSPIASRSRTADVGAAMSATTAPAPM